MRWGLVPSFAKRAEDYDVFKGGSSTFNARVESLEQSGLWRRLVDRKRGVILLDGFFEWKTVGSTKTPMFIRHRDGYAGDAIKQGGPSAADRAEKTDRMLNEADGPPQPPLLLAALYDSWRQPEAISASNDDGLLETTTIVTMEPFQTPLASIHDRMPVFLTPETAALWLDVDAHFADVLGLVLRESQRHANEELTLYEVPPLVSKIGNDCPECLMPKKEYDARQLSKGIGRFFQKAQKPTPTPPKPMAQTQGPPATAGDKAADSKVGPEKRSREEDNRAVDGATAAQKCRRAESGDVICLD